MIKISHAAMGGILATIAIFANLSIAAANHAAELAQQQTLWKSDIEQRLVRVETKLDRLLNVTQAALDQGGSERSEREGVPKGRTP